MSTNVYDDPALQRQGFRDTATTMVSGSHTHRRISWAAIFGGVILVVAVQLLWSLLGAGIGLGSVNLNAGTTPDASSFGIGAGAWWIISSIIALAFGGYVSAWLAGIEIWLGRGVAWPHHLGHCVSADCLPSDLGHWRYHWRRRLGPGQSGLRRWKWHQKRSTARCASGRHKPGHAAATGTSLCEARQPRPNDHEPAGSAEGSCCQPDNLRQRRSECRGREAAGSLPSWLRSSTSAVTRRQSSLTMPRPSCSRSRRKRSKRRKKSQTRARRRRRRRLSRRLRTC